MKILITTFTGLLICFALSAQPEKKGYFSLS